MATRHYIYQVVKREIDKWNPYGLLPEAPCDEFDDESKALADKLKPNSSLEEIANAASTVFSDSFEPQSFTVDKCMDVARRIKEGLNYEKE
jgi:hypothetical protein